MILGGDDAHGERQEVQALGYDHIFYLFPCLEYGLLLVNYFLNYLR